MLDYSSSASLNLGMRTHHWHSGEAAEGRAEDVLSVIAFNLPRQIPGNVQGKKRDWERRLKGGKVSHTSKVSAG